MRLFGGVSDRISSSVYLYFSICSLTALAELYIGGNQKLQTLPDDIGMMSTLTKLEASDCDLSHIPDR